MLIGSQGREKNARHPSIVADAAFAMLEEDGKSYRCVLRGRSPDEMLCADEKRRQRRVRD